MHELFEQVLSKKDLSKAGELFSLEDDAIENDLEEIVQQIKQIADAEEYESSDNDQSVVEICITRITTAIRESDKIEKHAQPLVDLLAMCLKHNLTPKTRDEDPPHAKIASDVMSRLFSYYGNKTVMTLAIPAVVRFLNCDNRELVRSVASYLSLAAIDNSSLLAQHMPLVLSSVLKGNYLLGQVLPQIYEENPQPVLEHVDKLAKLLGKCDPTEKVCFLQTFHKVARTHPQLLENHVGQLCTHLSSSLHSPMVLMILADMTTSRPAALVDHLPAVQAVVDSQPMLMYQVAQITGAVGTVSQEQAQKSVRYLVSKLTGMDQSVLPAVLQEIRGLGLRHHSLIEEHLDKICKLSTSGSSAVRLLVQQIQEDVRKHLVTSSKRQSTAREAAAPSTNRISLVNGEAKEKPKELRSVSSQTEGTVTVITVGNPPNTAQPSGTVSAKHTTLPLTVSAGHSGLPPGSVSSQQSLAKLHSSARTQSPESMSDTSVGKSYTSVGMSADRVSWHESIRDGVQLFCEKHFAKIKSFILKLNATIPLPVKCSVVNGKHKRYLKLHFECANQSERCLYSGSHFTLNTRFPKFWVHLMFLSVQARSRHALSQRDPNVTCLKACWDALKGDTTNSFLTLVTSSFPSQKDQLTLLHELHQMRYFDVFELNAAKEHWACFMCNHPERLSELLNDGCPEIAGQLKEKKGKWKFFKRWKTRYFTLSGGSITYNKSNATKATLPVTQIQSVKAVRKGIRDTPKAFEIFTGDQTYRFKAKGHHNVEQWVQCLHIAVARSQLLGPASAGVPSGLSASSSLISGATNGSAPASGVALRAGRRHVNRPSTYAGFFEPHMTQIQTVNPPPRRRVVMDTKL
ncbi:unnamed protein product [Candidula unifasciata]|uniref:PH domain-containing protein n=1 Tax=Candidula unifasciata TaxID=100452 RepID=A0A8S3YMR6_9EUPU|nr:unnamed protein product [Candidula unifasciata]